LKAQPDSAAGHALRGELLLRLGRPAEAAGALHQAQESERRGRKSQSVVYQMLAQAHSRAGDPARAAEDCTRALELDPDATPLLRARGAAYLAPDAVALAQRDFDRVLQTSKGSAEAYNGRGYCRVKQGEVLGAVHDAEEAVRLGPRTPSLCYNAARTLAQAAA